MRLRVLMLSVIGTAGPAFAQTTATPRPTDDQRTGSAPAERRASTEPARRAPGAVPQQPAQLAPAREDAAALLRRNGNSLLKASLVARADPAQARLSDISFTAVPVPEPKVIRKHDLVTIIVREESQYSSEGNAETTRESSIDAAVEDFIKLRLSNLEVEGGGIGPVAPRIAANANREFSGEGAVDRSDRLTARITAEVLDVKPNGTLVLQARKRIKTTRRSRSSRSAAPAGPRTSPPTTRSSAPPCTTRS
jgi:flagellar L-ring protein precursor FlgH